MQQILDSYNSGVDITQVQAQKSDPPAQVTDSFRDVQAAKADKERAQNEAEAYANDVIPRARGEAAKIVQEAEGYKKEVVAQAEDGIRDLVRSRGLGDVYKRQSLKESITCAGGSDFCACTWVISTPLL